MADTGNTPARSLHTWQIWAYLARPCAFSRIAIDEGVSGVPILRTALHLAKRAPCSHKCNLLGMAVGLHACVMLHARH